MSSLAEIHDKGSKDDARRIFRVMAAALCGLGPGWLQLTTKLEHSFVRVSALPLEKTAADQQPTDVVVAKPADRAVSLIAQPTRS